MAKKAPKCANKHELKVWKRSQGKDKIDVASYRREVKRLKKVK